MKQKEYIMFSGVIFGLVFALHFFRMIAGWSVTIGEWVIPMWVSPLGLIVSGFLVWKAFQFSR